jgi:pilus assembly protein CpaF
MIFNYLLIAGFVIAFLYILYRFFKYVRSTDTESVGEEQYETLEAMEAAVFYDISEKTSINQAELRTRVSERDAETMEMNRRLQADAIRNCTSGSEGTRDTTKQLVRNYVATYLGQGKRSRDRLRKLINFDEPSDRVMFETLCYVLGPDDDKGFYRLFEKIDIKLGDELNGKALRPVYLNTCSNLNDMQKQEVLVQLIYADTFGLGTIDTPNYQKGLVEEIQLGVGGVSALNFSNKDIYGGKTRGFAHDSVRFMIRGNVYRTPFLAFGNEKEFDRVITNLIKCSDGGELTASDPDKQIDTIDGRRLNVMCPPAVSATTAFIRKYDSFKFTTLHNMYKGLSDGDFVGQVVRLIIMTGRNISISGDTAVGKTSLLRVMIAELPPTAGIRSVEVGAWELELRKFLPDEYGVVDFKISDVFNERQCFERIKQSSGNVGVFGEVNSADAWNLLMNMTKFFGQTFWTTHETSTDHMIEAATSARKRDGVSDQTSAEREVSGSIHFDVRMVNRNGVRYIEKIFEVIPVDVIRDEVVEDGTSDFNLLYKGITSITRQLRKQTYKVVPILEYDEENGVYHVLNEISDTAKKGFEYRTGRKYPGLDGVRNNGLDSYLLERTDSPESAGASEQNDNGGIRLRLS